MMNPIRPIHSPFMPSFFRTLASYFFSTNIERRKGELTENIRVTFMDGKYHLNAK